MVWLVTVPFWTVEKLICPGVLSKKIPPAEAMVRVTGMVIDVLPAAVGVTTICAV
jgi:hypothetical protein